MNETVICRLCLITGNTTFIDVFGEKLEQSRFLEKILKFIGIEIRPLDNLPKYICIACLERIEEFSRYAEFCVNNQTAFLSLSISPKDSSGSDFKIIVNNQLSYEVVDIAETVNPTPEILTSQQNLLLSVLSPPPLAPLSSDSPPPPLPPPLTDPQEPEDDSSTTESDTEVEIKREQEAQEDAVTFPSVFIENSRLVVRGSQLTRLMLKFYTLECDLCPDKPKGFKSFSQLHDHFSRKHDMKAYVTCCGLKLIKYRKMALHLAQHFQPEAFTCPDCKKIMTCPKILMHHRLNHLPENEKPLSCKQCPRRFSYSSALLAHSITHLPANERAVYACKEKGCSKVFHSAGRLSTHTAAAHSSKSGAEYVCEQCAKSFQSKGNLSYHLTTHQPAHIHEIQCQICFKYLRNKICLRKHLVQHKGIRHQCQLCDYSAVNQQCLRNHLRVRHSDSKPHVCPECSRAFKLKSTLTNHLAQHSGIKRFRCEFCSRQFVSSGNYFAHRKRVHKEQLQAKQLQKEEEASRLREAIRSGSISTTTNQM